MSATVHNRGTTFEAYASGNGRRRRKKGFKTHAEAQEWADRVQAELEGRAIPREEGVTLENLTELAYTKYWEGKPSDEVTKSNIRQILRAFGPKTELEKIDSVMISDVVSEWRASGKSEKTCNRLCATLRKALKLAKSRRMIEEVPEIETFRESQGRIRYSTVEEEELMVAGLQDMGQEHYADLVEVLADTGMRCGEALRLEWKDVDLERGQVTIWENKASHPRTVPLTRRAQEVLTGRIILERAGPFLEDCRQSTFNEKWNLVRKQMGLEDDKHFTPHSLRHGFATKLVQSGVGLRAIQELLGHKRIEATLIYAHLAPRDLRDAVAVLEK